MNLKNKESAEYILLKKKLKVDNIQLFFAFLCIMATFLCSMFARDYVSVFLIGAGLPIGNVLLGRNTKQLIELNENRLNSKTNS